MQIHGASLKGDIDKVISAISDRLSIIFSIKGLSSLIAVPPCVPACLQAHFAGRFSAKPCLAFF